MMNKSTAKLFMTTKVAVICGLFLLHLPITKAEGEASAETVAAIKVQNELYMDAFSRGDAKAAARLHSEDGIVMPPQSRPLKGRAAIEAMLADSFSQGPAVLRLTTLDVQQAGELVYETGLHEVRAGQEEDNEVLEEGSYLVIWKRNEVGIWQLHVDIWNLN
jgi:ketosteroid isomerase-like protein